MTKDGERAKRLAAALRENLRRRKAPGRSAEEPRREGDRDPDPDPDPDPDDRA